MIQAVYAEDTSICTAVNKEKPDLCNSILRTTVRYGIVLERLEVRDYETGQSSKGWQERKNTSDK